MVQIRRIEFDGDGYREKTLAFLKLVLCLLLGENLLCS